MANIGLSTFILHPSYLLNPEYARYVTAEPRQEVAVDHYPDDNERYAGNDLEEADILLEAVENDQKLMHGQGRQEKGDGKPHRVGKEQHDAAQDGLLDGCDRQDG